MAPIVGDWWTMDDRGQGVAHRVGAVLPDLSIPAEPRSLLGYDRSWWIPLCACGVGACGPRTESATLLSTFVPTGAAHTRCSRCEVMSAALDRWIQQHPAP